jgi:rhomboid protease GluP
VNDHTDAPSPAPQAQRLPLPLTAPRLTYVLLAVNILVWLAMTVAGGSTNTQVLIRFGAKANVLIADGQVWRLLTNIFLHIGLTHLFFNSYALFVFGTEVERLYGRGRFLFIYFLAGLWGSLLSFAFGPSLSAGASGAIFGLLGTMVAFFRRHRETFGDWGRQRLLNLVGVAGLNLVLGFTVPGIDNLAHLGGLLSGAVLGYLLAPQYQVERGGGEPRVTDQVSLLSRWWVVGLACLLLVAGISGAMAVQRSSLSMLIYRGQNALESGDVTSAESLFRQAVARDPKSAAAHFYLGAALSTQDKVAEAIQAFQDTLRLDPELAEAHWNLALAYVESDQPQDAVAAFEAFIALSPDSPNAAQARAFITALQEPDQ